MNIHHILLDDNTELVVDSCTHFFEIRPPSTCVVDSDDKILREKPYFADNKKCVALFRGNIVFLENVLEDEEWDWATPGTTLRIWNWEKDKEKHVSVPSMMESVHANGTEIVTVDEDTVHFWGPKLRHRRNFSLHGGDFAGLSDDFYGVTLIDTILYNNETGHPIHRIHNVDVLALSRTCYASLTAGRLLSIRQQGGDNLFEESISKYSVECAHFCDDGTVLAVLLKSRDIIRIQVYVYAPLPCSNIETWSNAHTFDFEATIVSDVTGEILKQKLDFSISPSGEVMIIKKRVYARGDTVIYYKQIKT